ncbi:hypothetical protein JXB28_01785 [Candidatus Woesearchaeota archaeon]|nr:hypothetical protein [Candidatus Woesearchaeota archaeon]
MVKNLLIKGNSKMGSEVYLFNLPPVKTCTPTSWCLEGRNGKPSCYALRGYYTFKNVSDRLDQRLEITKQEDFVERMSEEIQKKKVVFFRFHASGDFYSEEYALKVGEIAKNCPNTLFRTTTRRRDLAEVVKELNAIPNLIVRESLDWERPIPVLGLPFAALRSLPIVKKSSAYACISDCIKCEYYCWQHKVNMHFPEK